MLLVEWASRNLKMLKAFEIQVRGMRRAKGFFLLTKLLKKLHISHKKESKTFTEFQVFLYFFIYLFIIKFCPAS